MNTGTLAEWASSVKPRLCSRNAVHNRPFRQLFTLSTGQPSYWRDGVTGSAGACTYDPSAIRSHHRFDITGEMISRDACLPACFLIAEGL
jgi:hypothetical protein